MKNRKKRNGVINFVLFFLIVLLGIVILFIFSEKNRVGTSQEENSSNDNLKDQIASPKERRFSLVMVGDALIHGAVYADAYQGNGKYDFTKMFTSIAKKIEKYDLKYYNQESIIGGGEPKHYPRLNSPDAIGENLAFLGFNMVSLANNHSLDQNEQGILYSNSFWKKQKHVIKTGTFSSWEERNEVPIYDQNGIKFSFLSYTMSTNGLPIPKGKEYLVNVYSDVQVRTDIEKAKQNGAEVIIVAMHWGNEYTHIPNAKQKKVAQYLSDLGVNLIIGSHPHVIQPITYINDTLVIYSLGNFISAQRVLGLEKVIGLLVGIDVVVKDDSSVSFENMNCELLYTYYNSKNRNFKVLPFSELTDTILKNYQEIEKEYREILNREV